MTFWNEMASSLKMSALDNEEVQARFRQLPWHIVTGEWASDDYIAFRAQDEPKIIDQAMLWVDLENCVDRRRLRLAMNDATRRVRVDEEEAVVSTALPLQLYATPPCSNNG